jgi:hypothetical protein
MKITPHRSTQTFKREDATMAAMCDLAVHSGPRSFRDQVLSTVQKKEVAKEAGVSVQEVERIELAYNSIQDFYNETVRIAEEQLGRELTGPERKKAFAKVAKSLGLPADTLMSSPTKSSSSSSSSASPSSSAIADKVKSRRNLPGFGK